MIADALLTIQELEEEIRRENDRRYAFYRMLHATDRVLWRLEMLNRDGLPITTGEAQRMRASLAELPPGVLESWPASVVVQELLDATFEVQDRLLRWRDPSRATEEDGDGG